MNETPIRTRGTVTAVLKPELCEVRLPNGKITLGHLSRPLRQSLTPLAAGDLVDLELTPFDFDSARIAAVHPPPEPAPQSPDSGKADP